MIGDVIETADQQESGEKIQKLKDHWVLDYGLGISITSLSFELFFEDDKPEHVLRRITYNWSTNHTYIPSTQKIVYMEERVGL